MRLCNQSNSYQVTTTGLPCTIELDNPADRSTSSTSWLLDEGRQERNLPAAPPLPLPILNRLRHCQIQPSGHRPPQRKLAPRAPGNSVGRCEERMGLSPRVSPSFAPPAKERGHNVLNFKKTT